MLIWFVVLYLMLSIGIGLYAATRVHTAKDFAVALVIVMLVEYPLVQLVMAIVIFSASSYLAVKLNPFHSRILAATKILNEFVYLCVCIIFLFYHFFGSRIPEERKYSFFGYSLISVIGIGVLVNILLGLLGFVLLVVSKCRKS